MQQEVLLELLTCSDGFKCDCFLWRVMQVYDFGVILCSFDTFHFMFVVSLGVFHLSSLF